MECVGDGEFEGDAEFEGITNVSPEREIFLRTFIHFVRPQMQLYAKSLKGYSKGHDKALTWATIGEAMVPPITGPGASILFGKLREKFVKERKKVLDSTPSSGAGAGVPMYNPSWILYKDLSFLSEHIQSRQTSSNFKRKPSPLPSMQTQIASTVVRPSPPVSTGVLPCRSAPPVLPRPVPSLNQAATPALRPVFRFQPPSSTLVSSPAWNIDLVAAVPPPTPSDNVADSGILECHSPSRDSAGTSTATASAVVLRAMANAIQPEKVVPVADTVKRRKRDADKRDDSIVQTAKEMSTLANTLTTALTNIGERGAKRGTSAPATQELPPNIQAFTGTIAAALAKVPDNNQLSCLMDILQVVKKYATDESS